MPKPNPSQEERLEQISRRTIGHYDRSAADFWEHTKDHDVSQNYRAFLEPLPDSGTLDILDLGCGPGRDVHYFKQRGHRPVGLDGSDAFCRMAREYTQCPIWHQDFLKLDLPESAFDGIFANATLFHVPRDQLVRVLGELCRGLRPHGILFSSNPRGREEGWRGERFGNFMEFPTYEEMLNLAGFEVLHHYYRPSGLPRDQQPWLAVVSRKAG